MFATLDILERSQSSRSQHCDVVHAKLTKIEKLHVSMDGKFRRAISRIARHQIPSQTRVHIDESSNWLCRSRLAVDPRPCGVVDTQNVDFLFLVSLYGSSFRKKRCAPT